MFSRILFVYAVCLGILAAYVSFQSVRSYAGNHGPFFATGIDQIYHSIGSWSSMLLVVPLIVAASLKIHEGKRIHATAYVFYAVGLLFTLQAMLPLFFD